MARSNVLTVRTLKAKCADYASSARARKLVSERELEDFHPGGARNADTTVHGWFYYACVLQRWHEREQIAAGRSVRPDQVPGSGNAGATPMDESTLLEMLSSRGKAVTLVTPIPGPDGPITELVVGAKSFEALAEIDDLDHDCAWLSPRVAVLRTLAEQGLAKPEDLELTSRCVERCSELVARIVWILTADGAACPYDPARDFPESVPRHLFAIDTLDLTRLLLAHREVNGTRLQALQHFIPSKGSADNTLRSSWSLFIASTANEIHQDPETLVRRWSLQKVVAAATLAARARLDAQDAAKAEAGA